VDSRETWSGSNGALSDTWDTIHPWGILLKETMPMETCPFLWSSDIVMNRDCYISTRIQHLKVEIIFTLNLITPICLNRRTWVLPIYQNSRFYNTIRWYRSASDRKVIVASYTSMWRILRVVVLRVFVSPRKAIWKWLFSLASHPQPPKWMNTHIVCKE
jgi:hypothetical protein